jgi:hypothetical protein
MDGMEGGGLGPLKLWDTQRILLDLIARAEDEEWAKFDQKRPCDGILILTNKARQLGFTLLARTMTMHRVLFYHGTRALAASVDEDKIKAPYDIDKRIYNCGLEKDEYSKKGGLPWWMRPTLAYDVKSAHINFALLGSQVLYQFASMGSGLGQGRQFDVGHCTEVAYWPEQALWGLDQDFFPTLPQSPKTLCLLESVSCGRSGWWYDMSKDTENGLNARWRYCFIPWYAEAKKYRRDVPGHWVPDELTEKHADMVWETSIKYCGKRVRLDKEQMYWWETTREEHRRKESLAIFFTNYAATPEEGFQHSTPSVLSLEVLERVRTEAAKSKPVPYLLRLDGTRTADEDWSKGKVPSFQIGKDAIIPAHPAEIDRDGRGIVWMWEPPKRAANYILGVDSTNGIIPWSREMRTREDHKTDNGAISIIRLPSSEDGRDIQVCEYAAPIDQESLGDVANLLGRLYGGANEDGQALAITEVHLGMGLPVIRRMMDKGYLNHFVWQHIDRLAVQNTSSYGWYASPTAVKILWEKFRKHMALNKLAVFSEFLSEELHDCRWDPQKMTANAASGKHDDRVRAISLAIWAAHAWGQQQPEMISSADADKDSRKKLDWQKSAVTWETMSEEMDELVESWLDQ